MNSNENQTKPTAKQKPEDNEKANDIKSLIIHQIVV